jgi:hypothetical protein
VSRYSTAARKAGAGGCAEMMSSLPLLVLVLFQSLTYSRGQNISPAYEGWEQAADGSRYFVFGYMNRNWEEEIDIPIGSDNGFNLGNPDQGQPTHFLPRRNRFVFRVRVPDGFTEKDEMIWTLTSHGKTDKAYASLRLDYVIDDVVKASETGALGAGTSSPEVRANRPPNVRIDSATSRTVKVGQPLALTAFVEDDGIPKRRINIAAAQRQAAIAPTRITVGKNLGLHVSWLVYRGAGQVTFDPPQVKVWEDTRAGANSPWAPIWVPDPIPSDGKITAQVIFSQPGTYVLRCRADDGALTADQDITVVVTQ